MSSYCNVCRICLMVCREFWDIFEFAPAIMECAPIKIFPGDGYPSVICEVCLDKLQAAQHFRVLCIQSDIILRQSNDETTIGIPHGDDLDYDTNSLSSQEENTDDRNNKSRYTHFMSDDVEFEPPILQCDTIIIDSSDEMDSEKQSLTVPSTINNNENSSIEPIVNELPIIKNTCTENIKQNDNISSIKTKKNTHKTILKCKKCTEKFSTKFEFRKHNKKVHLKEYFCKMCSRPLKNLNFRTNSIKTSEQIVYKNYCKYCYKIVLIKTLDCRTRKRERERERNKFNCDNCKLSFKTKYDLTKHKECHNSQKVVRTLRSYSKGNSKRKK